MKLVTKVKKMNMKKELSNVTKQLSFVFLGKVVALIFGLFFNFIAARY